MSRPIVGASAPPIAGQKRKAENNTKLSTSNLRKRQKAQDARAITVQSADAALSATGELNVASFIKAREFEIGALDKSMQNARKGLMSRAFQQVPRNMRRRTASHNVKKVPRRLRRRAEREMREDNTPTVTARRRTPSRKLRLRLELAKAAQKLNKKSADLRRKQREAKVNLKDPDPDPGNHVTISPIPRMKKNTISDPPKATAKFKKRQVHKTWLPTHLWHAKRAHMTKTGEPLWRMTIPLSPTEKSYRPTHRAGGSRGCIAWDVSYMATVGCRGTELALESMLKALGFHGESWSGPKCKRWKRGTRSMEGWLSERDDKRRSISPVTVIWCLDPSDARADGPRAANVDTDAPVTSKPKIKSPMRRLFIRIHPSAFHQCWLELLKVAKLQRPQVLLEDLRFEVGSIEITGPGSTEALLGVLKPVATINAQEQSTEAVWLSLAGLYNPASLPQDAMLWFHVVDPRLNHPPKRVSIPKEESAASRLAQLIVAWPPDHTEVVPDIFSHYKRHLAVKSMPSQKSIARRKTVSVQEQPFQPTEKDPCIPIMLIVTKPPKTLDNAQGSWIVLLPWKCLDAFWRSLMWYPLSSGSTPRFGGLNEKRQIDFERDRPWFPADAPGTEAGQAWERSESEKRFDEWIRRPPSRRIAWDRVILGNGRRGEHGRGWSCDWEFLLSSEVAQAELAPQQTADEDISKLSRASTLAPPSSRPFTQRQRKAAKAKAGADAAKASKDHDRRRNTSSPESDINETLALESEIIISPQYVQLTPSEAIRLFTSASRASPPSVTSLATVRINLLVRGTPAPAARIYRLPKPYSSASSELRNQWLELDPIKGSSTQDTLLTTKKLKKDKLNHRGFHKAHSVLGRDDPTFVYLPPDAHPDVVKQYGPEAQPARPVSPTAEEKEELLKELLFPGMSRNEREKHPACPDVEDLVGFVTTGSYNLAQGRGTAIGSVWVQRLLDGWKSEEADREKEVGKNEMRRRDREQHLCIVRNAGESMGRLGIWEVCG